MKEFTLVIHPNSNSGSASASDATFQPLQAWIQNDRLYIKGLTIGERWNVYSISGTLVYQGVAKSDVETQSVASLPNGTYVIHSGNHSLSIIY